VLPPPIDSDATAKASLSFSSPPAANVVVSVPLSIPTDATACCWTQRDHVWIELRIRIGTQWGATTVAGLAVQSFEGEAPSLYMNYLAGLPGNEGGEPKQVRDVRGEIIGGIITRKDLPPFGDVVPTTGG
jgi:hypothetical protein